MSAVLADWAQLLVRWLHVVVGAAWIGTSFYFVWLNNHVRPPEGEGDPGVKGELWAVHGGGFYRVLKYQVAPDELPGTLHWFKWEAYFTWITGVLLLALVYWMGAETYLIDKAKLELSPVAAVLISFGVLTAGWLVYDLLCRSPLGRSGLPFATVGFALATLAAWGLSEIFSDRAAYIHVGALLGTCMAGNVFFVIIPFQRKLLAAKESGNLDEAATRGERAAQRSLHNNYMTLPVLFIMVSNHYPMTYGHEWNWAVLAGLALVSAGVRHWFNLKGRGATNGWLLPASALGLVALVFVTAPRDTSGAADHTGEQVSFTEARVIVAQRCLPCHSAQPTFPGFAAPPSGVAYDTPEEIAVKADLIKKRTLVTRDMPLGNLTEMTEEERIKLARWVDQGAKIE